ncbi:MAG: hypothetical protein ACXWTS_11645 [Methylococcaceae bacterium]
MPQVNINKIYTIDLHAFPNKADTSIGFSEYGISHLTVTVQILYYELAGDYCSSGRFLAVFVATKVDSK